MSDEQHRRQSGAAPGREWIVGVDGSECSRHAALWAAANADGRADQLQITSTWSVPVSVAMGSGSALTTTSTLDALAQAASDTVTRLADDLGRSLDTTIVTSVGQGDAASLLLEAADGADLLVVGSRGHGGFARLVLGSTSTQCATHSTTPVAVIPSTTPVSRPHDIVVAFDGSDNAIAALNWAIHFADPTSVISCVFAWDTPPIAVGTDKFFFPEARDLAHDRFEHIVSDVADRHRRDDVIVRAVFAEGRPHPVLAAKAEQGDLLVMGSRGHGAIGAAILGSVSTWLLHHVDRAMIIVPHQDAGEKAAGHNEHREP